MMRRIAAQENRRRAGSGSWWKSLSGTTWHRPTQLNSELTRYAHEQQVFRIDHYLGKETVQNILMFRFSNSIFERLWNRDSVDHVQITVSENLGVGRRGGYYEEAGALRDMVQNHLLQVMSLVAMEPPVSLDAEPIRDEKVKLLKSIRQLTPEDVAKQVVRGQYFAGMVDGKLRPGYRQEAEGEVGFQRGNLRGGQAVGGQLALGGRAVLFADREKSAVQRERSADSIPADAERAVRRGMREQLDPNALTLRLQPNEGISLRFNGKVPGTSSSVRPGADVFQLQQRIRRLHAGGLRAAAAGGDGRRRDAVHPAR